MPRPTTRPALHLAALLATLAAGLATSTARAETSPWWLGASANVTHESNLYRLADTAQALPPGRQASDTVAQGVLMGGLDQPFGRQRLTADATVRQARFANNRMLDYGGHDLRLALAWATVERLSGDVVLKSGREFVGFGSDQITGGRLDRSLLGTRSAEANFRLGLVTRWSAELGASTLRDDYSAPADDWRDRSATQLRAGLRFRPHDLLSLGLGLRTVRTEYPRYAVDSGGNASAEQQRARFADLDGHWSPSGNSRLEGRLSLGRTRFEQFALQDSSGASGQLTWHWAPTGKMRLALRWARERGEDLQRPDGAGLVADSSRRSDVLGLTWNQELTTKLALQAGWRETRRDLVDDRSLGVLRAVRYGDDSTRLWQLGLRWAPTRSVDLSCDWTSERRRATGGLSSPFDARTLGCQARVVMR